MAKLIVDLSTGDAQERDPLAGKNASAVESTRRGDKQDPSTAKDGGFQNMIVRVQKGVRRGTSELKLSEEDIEQIAKYAFDYKNGGWEERLKGIFSRTLGSNLGRNPAN